MKEYGWRIGKLLDFPYGEFVKTDATAKSKGKKYRLWWSGRLGGLWVNESASQARAILL